MALHRRATRRTVGWLLWGAGCALGGGASTVDVGVGPRELRDPTTLYHEMGFLAAQGPIPFVASFHVLRSHTPDSTLVLLAISLASRSLSFRRVGETYEASYRVELGLQGDAKITLISDDVARVGSFAETKLPQETEAFQRVVAVPPGTYRATVRVTDFRGGAEGASEGTITVPRLGEAPGLTTAVPVYRATPRVTAAQTPELVVNPRGLIAYGSDTVRLYLEGYGLAGGSSVNVSLTDARGRVLWTDSVPVESGRDLQAWLVDVPSAGVPVGRVEARAQWGDRPETAPAALLMTFSELWITLSFEEMIGLLRYFEPAAFVDSLDEAPVSQRAQAWRRFWEATDPDPGSQPHEALNAYFGLVVEANRRFAEPGRPGWLSDRGEVYITLGRPDDESEARADLLVGSPSAVRWRYDAWRLVLLFEDESGFGRFRLTPASRVEYEHALTRQRHRP